MTLGSFWNPVHPGRWNTALYTGTSVFPDGKTQSKGPSGPDPGSGKVVRPTAGKCPPGYGMGPDPTTGKPTCLPKVAPGFAI